MLTWDRIRSSNVLSRIIIVGWIGIWVSAVNCAMNTCWDRFLSLKLLVSRCNESEICKESKLVAYKQRSARITGMRISKWGCGCELGMSVWDKVVVLFVSMFDMIFHIDYSNSCNGYYTYLQNEAIPCCKGYYLEWYNSILLIRFQSCRDNIHHFHIKYTTHLCTVLNTCEISIFTHSHILLYSFRSTIPRITTTTWRWVRYSRWLKHSIQQNIY